MASGGFVAVGDIHGCARTLEALCRRVGDQPGRTWVFLGDYIDRGPSIRETVDFLIEFSRARSCVFLRGNHEQMMLDAREDGRLFNRWVQNGGRTTLSSYGQAQMNFQLPSPHHHFFRNSVLYFDTPEFLFVHAGFDPDRPLAGQLPEEDAPAGEFSGLWERDHLGRDTSHWEKTVVFGHTPRPEPIERPGQLGIDTGCVYKNLPGLGRLTAVLLPERTFFFEPCIDHPNPY